MDEDLVKTRLTIVDFGEDKLAPEPPGVGIAVSFGGATERLKLDVGKPVVLHGAYQADQDLISLCTEGLAASILITVLRFDKPWGETARLVPPKVTIQRPPIPAGSYDPSYREGGQFQLDLIRFFRIPAEPGRYSVEASIGPYHSKRLEFELE
jgi:hypothetical protein